jgi:hypothetical protein
MTCGDRTIRRCYEDLFIQSFRSSFLAIDCHCMAASIHPHENYSVSFPHLLLIVRKNDLKLFP